MSDLFGSDQVSLDEAIQWIAEHVYPDEQPINAKKRVRARVRYASRIRQIKLLKKGSKEFLETESFLAWATTKWPVIHSIAGIPHKLQPATGTITLASPTCRAVGFAVPNDPDELKAAYIRAETERHRLEVENADLRSKIAELEVAITSRREKDAATRQKKSDAGKQGGRGRTK